MNAGSAAFALAGIAVVVVTARDSSAARSPPWASGTTGPTPPRGAWPRCWPPPADSCCSPWRYPILHYFHGTDVRAALPVRPATLDEAVTILAHGVAPGARLPVQVIDPLRAQLNGFLSTLHAQWIEPAWPAPAAPSLARCRAAGIPTASDADFEDALYERTGHRARLRGLVQSDGWTWEAVAGGGARKAAPDDRC